MSFNTLPFLLFLTVVFAVYYLPVFRRWQPQILILSSCIFYLFGGLYNFLFLAGSIFVNLIFRYLLMENKSQIIQKLICFLGVGFNVFILFFVKYGNQLMLSFGFNIGFLGTTGIVLPLGISFYTFQAISLLADTYKNEIYLNPRSGIVGNTVLYLSFFPNSLSGPLIRNNAFSACISEKRMLDIDWNKAIRYLIIGLFLKTCIADNLQNQTIYMNYPYYQMYGPIQLFVMMLAYSGQIFADFAGYSFMAQGIALLFGYSLPDNFRFPYISHSISEFWRRWHITLSGFFKQYVYIPLGGNRKGRIRTLINLFIVMVLCGFWHGSDWKYPIWGVIYGIIIIVERVFAHKETKSVRLFCIVKVIFVFVIVSWLWLFFKLDSLREVFDYTYTMLFSWNSWNRLDADTCFLSVLYCVPIAAYHLIYLVKERATKLKSWPYIYYSIYIGMALMIVMNRGTTAPFLYFQF